MAGGSRAMDLWRRQLQEALRQQLEDDSDEEFEKILIQGMILGMEDALSAPQRIPRFGGSRVGRKFVFREREVCHQRLFQDYFAESPTHDHVQFRRRFRMRRDLFLHIVNRVCEYDPWFVQKRDGLGRLGLSSLQKCSAAMWMLACEFPANGIDEYCRLGESTAIEAMKRFVVAIRGCFETAFFRQPTLADFQKQMEINSSAARGFPGMFASLDCMHWAWENCPVAWQGQFKDKGGDRSIILEAVVDQSLWIWHAFFGLPGKNNDVNVLDRSPIVANLLQEGEGSGLSFSVNGHEYPGYYLLTDGIYPQWSCFVQPIHEPQGDKEEYFTKMQAAARKDVERAFGALQARWEIIKNPCRQWELETINDIMTCCIILHNMIVQDEQGLDLEPIFDQGLRGGRMRRDLTVYELNVGTTSEMENTHSHFALRNDVIEYLWQLRGNSVR